MAITIVIYFVRVQRSLAFNRFGAMSGKLVTVIDPMPALKDIPVGNLPMCKERITCSINIIGFLFRENPAEVWKRKVILRRGPDSRSFVALRILIAVNFFVGTINEIGNSRWTAPYFNCYIIGRSLTQYPNLRAKINPLARGKGRVIEDDVSVGAKLPMFRVERRLPLTVSVSSGKYSSDSGNDSHKQCSARDNGFKPACPIAMALARVSLII